MCVCRINLNQPLPQVDISVPDFPTQLGEKRFSFPSTVVGPGPGPGTSGGAGGGDEAKQNILFSCCTARANQ